MNPDLGLVLINNLLQNAIRHNIEGGTIILFIQKNKFTICNSGKAEALNRVNLYERFQKKSSSKQSIGLGLAIVKEIVEISGLSLKYKFINNKHRFTLVEKKDSQKF